jgi:hypothetical protein
LEDPGGDTLTLAGQAEQQMLGAQPVAFQAHRLAPGQAEHQRGGLGHRQVEPHDLRPLSRADGLLDPAADRLHLDPQAHEGDHGQALLVTEQPQQQVLGADAVVAQPAGLLLGVQDRALGTLGDAHRPTSFGRLRPPRRARLVSRVVAVAADGQGLDDAGLRPRRHAAPRPGSW